MTQQRATLIANSSEYLEYYFSWCISNGFTKETCKLDIFDAENSSPPQISPLFSPEFYVQSNGLPHDTNPYVHYFTGGWKAKPLISRLIPSVHSGEASDEVPHAEPSLISVLNKLDEDERYAPHPLYDWSVHRSSMPSGRRGGFVNFLREPSLSPFSPYFDLDMLHDRLPTWNPHAHNPLIAYLDCPHPLDVNPSLFSEWYATEYAVHFDIFSPLDPLSHFLLIGAECGYYPNPFLKRDFTSRWKKGLGARMSKNALLEAVFIERYRTTV